MVPSPSNSSIFCLAAEKYLDEYEVDKPSACTIAVKCGYGYGYGRGLGNACLLAESISDAR